MGEAFFFSLRKILKINKSRENGNPIVREIFLLWWLSPIPSSEGEVAFAIPWSGPVLRLPYPREQTPFIKSVKYFTLPRKPGTVFQGRNLLIEVILKMDLLAAGSDWMVVWVKEVRGFLWSHGRGPFLLLTFYNAVTLKQCCHYLTFILVSTLRPGRSIATLQIIPWLLCGDWRIHSSFLSILVRQRRKHMAVKGIVIPGLAQLLPQVAHISHTATLIELQIFTHKKRSI